MIIFAAMPPRRRRFIFRAARDARDAGEKDAYDTLDIGRHAYLIFCRA